MLHKLIFWLMHHLVLAGTVFAAGSVALGDGGGSDMAGADLGDGGGEDDLGDGGGDEELGDLGEDGEGLEGEEDLEGLEGARSARGEAQNQNQLPKDIK